MAIVINSGSNLIFGEISFVINAAGPELQLAVSLNDSVFLLYRFGECRKEFPDKREAMAQALCRLTFSILSSGRTTVIGSLALCLMQFQIGPDLGLALAKGVAISLMTVFLFSPAMILQCSTLMDRLRHRSFMPCYPAQGSNDYYDGSGKIFGPETRLGADTQDVEEVFGQIDTCPLMAPKGNTAREEELSARIRAMSQVSDVLAFVNNAGATGKMAMTLSIRRNPDCTGDFFDTHALQVAASLDTRQCSNITVDGAIQANVGSVRQLNWIVLPGTETDLTMSASVRDFEMRALSINGVRMQLDPGQEVVDDALPEMIDKMPDVSDKLPDPGDILKNLPKIDISGPPTMPNFQQPGMEENHSTLTDFFGWLIPSVIAEKYSISPEVKAKVA